MCFSIEKVFIGERMDIDEEFYIYLRSVENTGIYPNIASSFTNVISPVKNLSSEFEVGLQNIIFNPLFNTISSKSNEYTIKLYDEKIKAAEDVVLDVRLFTYKPSVNITGNTFKDAIDSLNNDFMQYLVYKDLLDNQRGSIFAYNNSLKRVIFKNPFKNITSTPSGFYLGGTSRRIRWEFSEKLGDLLGLITRSNKSIEPKFFTVNKIIQPQSIFIYSDIVEPSTIGSQSTSILDIIPGPLMYAKNSVGTIYKNVNKKVIDDISIKLCDEKGVEVSFNENVVVTMILHFRPKA